MSLLGAAALAAAAAAAGAVPAGLVGGASAARLDGGRKIRLANARSLFHDDAEPSSLSSFALCMQHV
jgi:hypothetical protein